jgi:predicted nucleic acid-binding protein
LIVLDASAVLEFLLRTPIGLKVARRIAPADETLHAPHLIDLEVAQVLRRREASRSLSRSRAEQAIADFSDLDFARYPHDALLPRIWALRKNVTAYDAAYLALSEALDAPLLTADEKLARSPGHKARVEVVALG